MHLAWFPETAEMAVLSFVGLALSHALRLHIQRQRWRQLRLGARIGRIIAASLLLGMLAALLKSVLGLAAWQNADIAISPPLLQHLVVFLQQIANWTFLFLL